VYWVSVRLRDGSKDRFRSGKDKRQAQRDNERCKREVRAGTYQSAQAKHQWTVGEYVRHHCATKGTRTAKVDLQCFEKHVAASRWFEAKSLVELAQADSIRWVDDLKSAGLSPKTLRNVYNVYTAAVRDALARGLVDRDPCVLPRRVLPKIVRKRRELYDPSALSRLVNPELAGERGAALFTAAAYLGARRGEILGAIWGDISEAPVLPAWRIARTYRGAPLKTGSEEGEKERMVPIHPVLQAALARWRGVWELIHLRAPTASDPIFPAAHGGHLGKDGGARMVESVCKRAGVEGLGIHTLRHSFITLARRHATAEQVEPITHNSAGRIIDLYTHWQWEPLCQVVLGVDYSLAGATQGATRFLDSIEISNTQAPPAQHGRGCTGGAARCHTEKHRETPSNGGKPSRGVSSQNDRFARCAARSAQRVSLAKAALLYAAERMGVAA
jgi:integrase